MPSEEMNYGLNAGQRDANPLMVSLASSKDSIPQNIEELYKKEEVVKRQRKVAPVVKQSIESSVTFKLPRYKENQLSNVVVLPKELQKDINKSDDEKHEFGLEEWKEDPQNIFGSLDPDHEFSFLTRRANNRRKKSAYS